MSGRPGWLGSLVQLLPAQREAEEKRRAQQELADRYIAAGQTKVANGRYASAVASYNRALCLQREALGEDHIQTGLTLHEIGLCLARIGEQEAAKIALKEALYIKLKEYGPEGDETKLTKAILGELMHSEIEKSRRHSEEHRSRRSLATSSDEESSKAESSKLHDSLKWEYSLDLDEPVSQQRRSSDGGFVGLEQPIRGGVRRNGVDRRRSDPDGTLPESDLHDDYHYREFMIQDSGSNFGPSLGSYNSSDSLGQSAKKEGPAPHPTLDGEQLDDNVGSPSLRMPNDNEEVEDDQGRRLTEEERAARSAEVLSAVDDIEKSIVSSFNSFSVGPEGKVEISSNDKAARRGSLKAIAF